MKLVKIIFIPDPPKNGVIVITNFEEKIVKNLGKKKCLIGTTYLFDPTAK